ncbi:MAG: nucleoside kinase [Synergistaceae bacterium]|nr:nucleoside kinase [Synergistaceae bacterium]
MSLTISFNDMQDIKSNFPITARDVLTRTNFPKKDRVVACRVNRVQRPLSWKIDMDSKLEFITSDTIEGAEVYLRTISFMLTSAATRVCGIRLHLRQSMNFSYFYDSPDGPVTDKQKKSILNEMQRMVKEGVAVVREELSLDKARIIMTAQGYNGKERLLRWVNRDPVIMYRIEGIYDFFGGALADNAAIVPLFELHLYKGGIFISGPLFSDPTKTVPFKTSTKTFALFNGYAEWLDNLHVSTMDKIHSLVANGLSRDFIMVCEALHTKKLSEISSHISERPEVRLLCLAGPSSSGKTTSSRRIRVQLLASCINSATLELDSYFVERSKTPRDSNGDLDFEALEALDLDLINQHLAALLEGKEIDVPKFDFITGERKKGYKLKLAEGQILIIEGIHGLNDKLSESVSHDNKYRIFISPLTGAAIDMHNRIGTTDTRLLRRMLRDYRTRGHSPEATLLRWPSVIRGSHRHIFPYQENADALFNTSLAYEFPVLKGYVQPMLSSVEEDSPAYGEAQRLLAILSFVPIIPSDDVPNTSILREFIGGSCFE